MTTIDLRKYQLGTLPKDGGAEAKCYAKSLGNCDGGISREHFISESVLEQIGKLSGAGIPWIGNPNLQLTPDNLSVNCLCKRHNNFLSPLDTMAGEFFKLIGRFAAGHPEKIIVSGKSLERWFLKCLLGALATNKFEHKGVKVNVAPLNEKWVPVIFGLEDFPNDCGLHFFYQVGEKLQDKNSVSLAPIFNKDTVEGLESVVGFLRFYLTLCKTDVAFKKEHPLFDQVMPRPSEVKREENSGAILFDWN